MTAMRRLLWIALFGAILLAPVATAHGYMLGSTPGSNQRLDAPPTQITVRMSETIDVSQAHIHVFDINGTDHSVGDPTAPNNASKSAVLFEKVNIAGNGTYTVAWEALWPDSHVTQGGFAFAVGNASLANAYAVQTTGEVPPWGDSA